MILCSLLENSRFARLAILMLRNEYSLHIRIRYLRFELVIFIDQFINLLLDQWKISIIHKFAIFLFATRWDTFIIVLISPFQAIGSLDGLYTHNRNIYILYEQTGYVLLLQGAEIVFHLIEHFCWYLFDSRIRSFKLSLSESFVVILGLFDDSFVVVGTAQVIIYEELQLNIFNLPSIL